MLVSQKPAAHSSKAVSALYQILFENTFSHNREMVSGRHFSCEYKKNFQMKKKMHTIAYIKRQAKNLKKQNGISHTQALDLISKQHGYSNWKHYQKILSQHTNTKVEEVTEVFQITFTDWLKRHKNRNSPLGDLATDMLGDKQWPSYNSLKDYQGYLNFRHASIGAIEAIKRAWRTYTAYVKKKNEPVSDKPKLLKHVPKNHDLRKITFVKNVTPLHYVNRIAEKFNSGDKAWISWDGRKAIPITILEVDDRHYAVRIERPIKSAGIGYSFFLDEVRSTPELACMNRVTS
jgi:YozE SAM-like fold/Glyoxalase superfamily protein